MSDFLNSLPSDPEPLTIERDLTIRAVQQQMEANLKRWYPEHDAQLLDWMTYNKAVEEQREWRETYIDGYKMPEECADVIISMAGYCAMNGIDLQAEIEKKLKIVSARTDQAEGDRARGIG